MAVRIKIEIQAFNTSLQTAALLNSGFESESAEILIPHAVAEEIGFLPVLPAGTSIKSYETVGGIVKMYSIKDPVNIKVITDIKTTFVNCTLIISEIEREVILSDTAIDKLKIIIDSPGTGLWKFKNEKKLRKSLPSQYW